MAIQYNRPKIGNPIEGGLEVFDDFLVENVGINTILWALKDVNDLNGLNGWNVWNPSGFLAAIGCSSRGLVGKRQPITAANRSTPHDRSIQPNIASIVLDRRTQNTAILRELSLG